MSLSASRKASTSTSQLVPVRCRCGRRRYGRCRSWRARFSCRGVNVGVGVQVKVADGVGVAVGGTTVAVGNGVQVGNGVCVGRGVYVGNGVSNGTTLAMTPAASVSTTPTSCSGVAVTITISGGTGVFVGLNSGRTTVGVGVSTTGDGTTDGSGDSSHPTDAPTANTKPTTRINKDLNACSLVETIASRLYVSTSSHQSRNHNQPRSRPPNHPINPKDLPPPFAKRGGRGRAKRDRNGCSAGED